MEPRILIFSFRPSLFLWTGYEEQKGLELDVSLRLQHKFRKTPDLVIDHLGNLDDLVQSGFQVIPKITCANLYKPIHSMINLVSSISLNLEIVESKEKNCKNLNNLRTNRDF